MLKGLLDLIKKTWGRIPNKGWLFLSFLISILFFAFILFPTRELNDLITAKVSQLTNKSVYLELTDFSPRLIPLGLRVEGLRIDGYGLKDFHVKSLKLEPSMMGMIAQKPYGSLELSGLFGGDAEIDLSKGKITDNGGERFQVNLAGKDLSLGAMMENLKIQIPLTGKLTVDTKALIDPTFTEQPDADLAIKIDLLSLASTQVNTMMGPLPLPEVKLKNIELVGRLAAGKFIVEKGLIGKPGDELVGNIKGDVNVQLRMENGRLFPVLGAYQLSVDLNTNKSFMEKAKLFLVMIDNYKQETPVGASYKFKISATQFGVPPQFTGIH
jgi:type II secretion system protein N